MAVTRLITLFLLGLLITLAGTAWPNLAFTKGYQFDWSPLRDLAVGFGYYIVTLTGILSSILFKKLETKSDETISFRTLGSILSGGEGIRGIIVSPLIFIFVINAFGKDANGIMTVAFAYQNGFFWQQILQKFKV